MIKALATITLYWGVDVTSVTTYYLKQSSTLTPPSKPTDNAPPPSSWTTVEPTYTAGETTTLYTVVRTIFNDGSSIYSDVSKSTSYEAAKAAYNRAVAASNEAQAVSQYFWTSQSGSDAGVHVTQTTKTDFLANHEGGNLLATSDGIAVRDGLTALATFMGDGVNIGLSNKIHSTIRQGGFGIAYDTDRLFDVSTNGVYTDIYMGGSAKADGVSYTDIQVSQTISYLNDGCTIQGSDVYNKNGEPTGYTAVYNSATDSYNILDTNGGSFSSGSYEGIYYAADTQLFEGDVRLVPLEEIPTAQAIVSMGGVGVSGYNKQLNIDAEGISSGYYSTASGKYSHAEGFQSEATERAAHAEGLHAHAEGMESHAEGSQTHASGMASHAEGTATHANGNSSHAAGRLTIASGRGQTAIGIANIEDTNNVYALIIGNGNDRMPPNITRSNALTVAWDGNVEIALDTTAASGTTDGDLYAAITALGWGNEVIV